MQNSMKSLWTFVIPGQSLQLCDWIHSWTLLIFFLKLVKVKQDLSFFLFLSFLIREDKCWLLYFWITVLTESSLIFMKNFSFSCLLNILEMPIWSFTSVLLSVSIRCVKPGFFVHVKLYYLGTNCFVQKDCNGYLTGLTVS